MARLPITKSRPYTPSSGNFAGRTFHTEREYRDALARLHGYASWDAQREAAKRVADRRAYRRLRPSEREAYDRVATAVTLTRHDRLSLAEAARRAGTTPAAVRKFAGDAVVRDRGGRYRVTTHDSLLRRVWFLTPKGNVRLWLDDSDDATLVARYDNELKKWLANEPNHLADFSRRFVRAGRRRHHFVTDTEMLTDLEGRGKVSFESIYADAA